MNGGARTDAPDALRALEERIGHRFADPSLVERALTHSSFANEAGRGAALENNERLEFLGDSVVGFLVAELLYESHPGFREGMLSKGKGHLVSEGSFASKARELGLGPLLRLAVGESRSGGRVKDSLLADAFEALMAALYLDAGLDAVRRVVRVLFETDVAALDPGELSFHDYKTALQELAQGEGKPLPVYRLLEESGPSHEKTFVFEVAFDETLSARGSGSTKKEAQRQAAKALLALKLSPTPSSGRP